MRQLSDFTRGKQFVTVCLALLLMLLVGCGGRSSAPTQTAPALAAPTNPANPRDTSGPAQQAKPIQQPWPAVTADSALDTVRKLAKVAAYVTAVEARGWKVKLHTEETPTRFIVSVGEDQGPKIVNTLWYLVSKADGSVTEWDVIKGPVPLD